MKLKKALIGKICFSIALACSLTILSGTAESAIMADSAVYDDELYWEDWSWRTSVNPDSTERVHTGQKSLRIRLQSAWAGLSLHTDSFYLDQYDNLEFFLHPNGNPIPNIAIGLYDNNDQFIKSLPLSQYLTKDTDGWYHALIPLDDLRSRGITHISRVQLQDDTGGAQPAFMVDNLIFSGQSTSQSTSSRSFHPDNCSGWVSDIITTVADKYNLPRWFYFAIINRESWCDPDATGPNWPDGDMGLTQLNTAVHLGQPYPEWLQEPDNDNQDYRWDMNFKQFGRWILMTDVTRLENPFDAQENLERFSSGYAVRAFQLFKKIYALSDIETLRAVAFHWNKGLFRSYDPDNTDFLATYDKYVGQYRPPVEQEDGIWDGLPGIP